MKCDRHSRSVVGQCMWCGKKLCEHCVARTQGSKIYCEPCTTKLGSVARAKIPQVGKVPVPHTGRKYRLENGYLVLEA